MNGPNWYHWLQSYEKKLILTHFSQKSFCFSINMNKKKAASLCEVAAYVVKMRSSGFVWQE